MGPLLCGRRGRHRHPLATPRPRHLTYQRRVSIEAVRRLGHASTETTQLYTLLDDQVADAEIRAARRRRDRAARPRNDITPYDPGGEQEHSP